jgi:hypothetical protein
MNFDQFGRLRIDDQRGRVGIMDPAIFPPVKYYGIYMTCNHMVHTTAGTNGSYYWNLRGPPTGAAYILYMNQVVFCSVTTAANTHIYWDWRKQTGAASPTGGSAQVIHKFDGRQQDTRCVDIRGSGGGTSALTMTGITPPSVPPVIIGNIVSNGAGANPSQIDMTIGGLCAGLRIGTNEHWSMRLGAGAAGFHHTGWIVWAESYEGVPAS